jgi:hypothetical protein
MQLRRTWPAGALAPRCSRPMLPIKIVLDDLLPEPRSGRSVAAAALAHCSLAVTLAQLLVVMTSLIGSLQKQALWQHPPGDSNIADNHKDSNHNNCNDNHGDNHNSMHANQDHSNDDDGETSSHSSNAWSLNAWEDENDSFHSSDDWSRCAEERAYESDSELDREFDAIDWRPETPPSVGALYSSMHDDLNSPPFMGTAPVSCASGTLPTTSVGDLARSSMAHMSQRTANNALNKPNEQICGEGARNLGFQNINEKIGLFNSLGPAGSFETSEGRPLEPPFSSLATDQ